MNVSIRRSSALISRSLEQLVELRREFGLPAPEVDHIGEQALR